MESIDALAQAVNEFSGGLVLVSHDMRLISQVAKEIWICDHQTVKKYGGDIQNFKMDMRSQLGIEGEQKGQLRGDASVQKSDKEKKKELKTTKDKVKPVKEKQEVLPVVEEEKKVEVNKVSPRFESLKPKLASNDDTWGSDEEDTASKVEKKSISLDSLSSMKSSLPSGDKLASTDGRYVPPMKSSLPSGGKPASTGGRYVPPHLRNR